MISLKKKIIIGLIIVAIALFLLCLYFLYTSGWGNYTIEKFDVNTLLDQKQITIQHPSNNLYWNFDLLSGNIINLKPTPITFTLYANNFTYNNTIYNVANNTNGNVVLRFNTQNIDFAIINKSDKYLYAQSLNLTDTTYGYKGHEILYSYNLIRLQNGTYFILAYADSSNTPYFVGYNSVLNKLQLLNPTDNGIVTWILDFPNNNHIDPNSTQSKILLKNISNVKAIKIIGTSNFLSIMGLFVYDEYGNVINMKDNNNGYNYDSNLTSIANFNDTKNLNPVQSFTYSKNYAQNCLELSNYNPNTPPGTTITSSNNIYLKDSKSPNLYRTLSDATNSNNFSFNKKYRFNNLIYPLGFFNADSTNAGSYSSNLYYSNTEQYNSSWYYKFSNTVNISGVEIFTFALRGNGMSIQFIDNNNNMIATGFFENCANDWDDSRRIFVVQNYPVIPIGGYTIIKQVIYDAVYADSGNNPGQNINIPSIFPIPQTTYSSTNINYGFNNNTNVPLGSVYASGQFDINYASNIWFNTNSKWLDFYIHINTLLPTIPNTTSSNPIITGSNTTTTSPSLTQNITTIYELNSTTPKPYDGRYSYFNEYRFSNNQAIILKSYSIITSPDIATDDNKYQTPTLWDLLGSNDGSSYYIIDSQDKTSLPNQLFINSNTINFDLLRDQTFINNNTGKSQYKFKYIRLGIKRLYNYTSGNSYNTNYNPNGIVSLGGIRLNAFAETDFPNPIKPLPTPPASTPPASTPPASTPPASTPPASTPLASTPPASTPPASTPPASTPPALTPPASTPPALTPPASTTTFLPILIQPASTLPVSTLPVSANIDSSIINAGINQYLSNSADISNIEQSIGLQKNIINKLNLLVPTTANKSSFVNIKSNIENFDNIQYNVSDYNDIRNIKPYADSYNNISKIIDTDNPLHYNKVAFNSYMNIQNKKIADLNASLSTMPTKSNQTMPIKAVKNMGNSQILNLEGYPSSTASGINPPNDYYLVYANNNCVEYMPNTTNSNDKMGWALNSCNASNPNQQFKINQINTKDQYNNLISDSKYKINSDTNTNFGFYTVNPNNTGFDNYCMQLNNDGLSVVPCNLDGSQRYKPLYKNVLP